MVVPVEGLTYLLSTLITLYLILPPPLPRPSSLPLCLVPSHSRMTISCGVPKSRTRSKTSIPITLTLPSLTRISTLPTRNCSPPYGSSPRGNTGCRPTGSSEVMWLSICVMWSKITIRNINSKGMQLYSEIVIRKNCNGYTILSIFLWFILLVYFWIQFIVWGL